MSPAKAAPSPQRAIDAFWASRLPTTVALRTAILDHHIAATDYLQPLLSSLPVSIPK